MIGAAALAALLLWPAIAQADPGTIAAVVSFWAQYGTYVQLALLVAGVYGSVDARRKARTARARQRSQYNESLENRSVTVLTAAPPWRIIYGRPGPVGGAIVAIFTSDKSSLDNNGQPYTKPDALKHLVVEIAHHECTAIHEVYLEGVPVGTLDGNGYATAGEFYKTRGYTAWVDVPAGGFYDLTGPATGILSQQIVGSPGTEYETITETTNITLTNGNTRLNNPNASVARVIVEVSSSYATVRIQKHLGTSTQTVDTYLQGLVPSQWDANHRLRGATYAVITLDLEEPRFQGGPPNFTFDVSGKPCYDPRTGLTVYTENNALCIRDFLTADYGFQTDAADINAAALTAAANACDELITLVVGATSTPNQPRFTLNGTFTTADSKEQILEAMADSMAGVVTNAGEWFVRAGVWTSPVMDLTEADLDGLIEFQRTATDYEEIYNSMRGLHVPRNQATPVEFDQYQNAAFVTADGEELWEDKDLPFTDNRARARNLCRIFVESNRLGETITYPAKLRAIRLQPGDRVRITSAEHGWSLKSFRVVDWQLQLSAAVMLSLREDAAASYDLADAATAYTPPATGLPSPWVVTAPTSVAVTSVLRPQADGALLPTVTVSWAAITSAYVTQGGYVRVRWARGADSRWISADVPGDARESTFAGPPAGQTIVVGVLAENSNGARSVEVFESHTLPAIAYGSGVLALVAHGTADTMSISGNHISRAAGATGWIAGAYSAAPVQGACRLTFRVPQANRELFVGLNSDPATDANWTSIDYGLNLQAAGTAKIYESGTDRGSVGSYAAGQVCAIEYDGQAIKYWIGATLVRQVAAPPGLTLYLDSSFYETGARIEDVHFTALAPAQRGNLLDAGSWISGTTGSQGTAGGSRFNALGAAAQSSIVLDYAPDGVLREVWQCGSDGGDPNGGWAAGGDIPIDHRRGYRFAVWVKQVTQASASGVFYLGAGPNVALTLPGGAAENSPYFVNGLARLASNFMPGRWYLAIGYMLPSTYGTTQLAMGGLWDGVTGQKVAPGQDFKWVSGAAQTYHRAFMFYANNTSNVQRLWGPRMEMVDGSEPSIDALLAMAKQPTGSVSAMDFAASIGLNGQFTLWTAGADVPDGWVTWGTGTRIKEGSVTRTGPNAFRVQAAAADVGAKFTHDFTNRPTAGSYLRVSVDMRIVTHTSGGKPGVLVRLYTNAGFTTYRDTQLVPPTMTTGEWQTIAANCSVQTAEQIYRIEVYMMGSWSSLPGGAWTGDVIFDSLLIDMMSPADTDHIAAAAATDVFTSSDATIGPSGYGTGVSVTLKPGWRVLVTAQGIWNAIESAGSAGFFRGYYELIGDPSGSPIYDSRFFRKDVVANEDFRVSAVMSYEYKNTGTTDETKAFYLAIDGTTGGTGNKGSGTLTDARLRVEVIKR